MIEGKLQKEEHPAPLLDSERCTGCGLCIKVCPTGAWALQDGKAVVAHPEACEYTGYCEWICPTQAIARPFQIILAEGKE